MLLRRKLTVLLMAVMLLMLSAAPALAHHDVGHVNNGNKSHDGADANQGGGQEKAKNENHQNGWAE